MAELAEQQERELRRYELGCEDRGSVVSQELSRYICRRRDEWRH